LRTLAPRTLLLALLIGVAVAQRAWNLFMVPPLTGYDAPGHAGYMLTIVEEGRLPHPHEGWSTFHPPLYYLLGALVWVPAEPFGPRVLVAAVGSIGALAGLLAAVCAYRAVVALGYSVPVAWVACALALFVPVAQLAGVMLGNEALVAGFASGALLCALALQRRPAHLGRAAAAGGLAGLAIATKYTGAFVLPALALAFLPAALRRERGWHRAAALALGLCALLAAPSYARNLWLTGELLPMTRDREPMRGAEAALVLRPRRVTDYLTLPWSALRRPSLYHEPGRLGSFRNRNLSMTSVPGLFYASLWYDPFGHRTSVRDHRDGVWFGPALTFSGLLPTLLVLVGFARSLGRAVRSRGTAPDSPLSVSALLAGGIFLAITWTAPSAAAVKSSYLLPLLLPAAVFFAAGVDALPRALRAPALVLCGAAAALAALVFTADLLYPSMPMGVRVWLLFAEQLPGSHIRDALERMLIGW
jgi:4-amino-4-deoxy-L-arabinose transferase-like glycosyltransferase